MENRVCAGAIAGAFGVSVEVRIKSFCAEPADIANYSPLSTEDGERFFDVRLTNPVSGGLGARLSGIDNREAAEALRGTTLWADRDALPGLPDDEFYHADLIGLDVVDPGGVSLGRVRAVHDYGAGDILEIQGNKLLLLPFTRATVPTVDLAARRIVADPPGDLADDTDAADITAGPADL